jgi:protein-S-isoprenylcysteine O-methyltransferase Ste14
MSPRVFVLVYVVGFIVLRGLSRLATRSGSRGGTRSAIVESRVDLREGLFIALFLVGGLILPVMALRPWLPQLWYALPDWASWMGVVILGSAGLLHWRAHADLGRNYSATVLLRDAQSLVTTGVYAWIRHPIYASLWLIVIAQPLLVHHWIFGLSGLPTFALLFFHRLRREEGMMIRAFGDPYRDYMRRVGGVIPKRRAAR